MQKIAVVTGGSRGIGLAIVSKFLQEGFKVVSISRNIGDLSLLKETYADLLEIVFADLSIPENVKSIGQSLRKNYRELHVLVNNAGVFIPGEVASEEDASYALQMALNIDAAYYMSKALIPSLKQSKDGYLFNICSTASIQGYPNGGSYCISKHALLGLSRVLRLELMPYGIAVSAIMPGPTMTDSWKDSDLPRSRFIEPQVIADHLYLAWKNRASSVLEEIVLRPLLGDI